MESVSLFEAKTHLSALVERVESGESVVITKHGKPAAKIVPYEEPDRQIRIQEAIDKLRAIRKKTKPVTLQEILDWRHDGHRF